MFDCVIPTRTAAMACSYRNGIINIRNIKWKDDFSPLEEEGEVFPDYEYSKAYLRHLFVSKEILAAMIATIHNLGFYMWLMRTARLKIAEEHFRMEEPHGRTTDAEAIMNLRKFFRPKSLALKNH